MEQYYLTPEYATQALRACKESCENQLGGYKKQTIVSFLQHYLEANLRTHWTHDEVIEGFKFKRWKPKKYVSKKMWWALNDSGHLDRIEFINKAIRYWSMQPTDF